NEKVPHNYLSVGLIPFRKLGVAKDDAFLLAHVVGYHHEREHPPQLESIKEVLENDIRVNLEKLAIHTGLAFPKRGFNYRLIRGLNKRYWPPFKGAARDEQVADQFWEYVLLKGLLHRLDHTASDPTMGAAIEVGVNEHAGDYVRSYFKKMKFNQNKLQVFTKDNREKNVIAVAQTGMGKTEAALYWIGEDKAYFTLPIRVSANAIYDRISDEKQMGYIPASLLHSTSVDYLIEKEEDWERIINQSRHLASKLTITTIDQVLKFPFYYRGFEKELATLAYSKVVIDEIQAYDPKIVAMLIKALEMIHLMGGKFMIMTATLPPIYLEKLKERGYISPDALVEGRFLDDNNLRHRIELRDMSITDTVDEVIAKGLKNQVLVIVNTVNQGIRLYESIGTLLEKEDINIPLHLLHGRFTLGHRQLLEDRLLEFNGARPKPPGIWITTQIVEASLDIDFDYLFTELSTLDSLFQRLGRCYRKRVLTGCEANVSVFTQKVSGVPWVYDRYLLEEGLSLLRPYHNSLLTETDKVRLVEDLYSYKRLIGTKFLKELESSLEWFDDLEPYNLTKQEAQAKMRDIQKDMVLPISLWREIEPLIEEYKKTEHFSDRYLLKRKIEQFTVPVWKTQRQKGSSEALSIKGLEHIYYTDLQYDFCPESYKGKGLVLDDGYPGDPFV
ncbi:MAG TPA: CRISPR-associated helicase Cas3', partial [Anaerovoracaceae bacterium]|nr:CRISPR-associated helicase Cas3' [Anaerovoracaceae bacterium]